MIAADNSSKGAALQPGDRLKTQLAWVRRQLVLPEEWAGLLDSEEMQALRAILRTTPTGQPLIQLANQLGTRTLRLVFPLLVDSDDGETLEQEEVEKVFLIIRERACWSLYRSGWTLFQACYPSERLAQGLAILCGILQIKTWGQDPVAPKARQPLISDLLAPDRKHWPQALVKVLDRKNLPPLQTFASYGIDPDQPLGQAVIHQLFVSGSTKLWPGSHPYLPAALDRLNQHEQAKLLKRFFSLAGLSANEQNAWFQEIYRRFGTPQKAHPVWQAIRPADRKRFELWVLEAVIGTHCRDNHRKVRFYHRYAPLIQAIEPWGPNILVISFPGFLIADDRNQPLFALYYDGSDPGQLLKGPEDAGQIQLSDLPMPHRRVEDALKRGSTQGVVVLFFDEGIRASRSFVDFCLLENRAASARFIRNLAYRSTGQRD